MKKIDALFGRGELSYSKVRAITRVATPESEQDFIDAAVNATAAQIERIARAYRRALVDPSDPSGQPRDQRRFVRRSETLGGMVRIEMQLPPEEAAVVWEAMIAAAERDDRSLGRRWPDSPRKPGARVPSHHRMIHEGALSTEIRAGKITFVDRQGRDIPIVPRVAATGRDLEELELFLREADLHINPSMTMPKWDGTPMDLADTLAWMFIADQTRK